MTMISISDALKTAPDTLLDGVLGVIKAIGERWADGRMMAEGSDRPLSIQTIVIAGKNGDKIVCELSNQPLVPKEKVNSFIWLIAHQKTTGGKSGVKVCSDNGNTILRISASATIDYSAPGSAVPQPLPPSAVETDLPPGGKPQVGAAGLGGAHTSPLETEGSAKEKSARLNASVSSVPVDSNFYGRTGVIFAGQSLVAAVDEKVRLYALIRKRVVLGIGEQLPDQDATDAATKTIFESMILSGPF